MADRIRLEGIEVYAYHGVLDEEKEHGQTFIVDVELELDLAAAAKEDDLSSTIDYGELAIAVHDRVSRERWDLIERVAERVADLVLEDGRVTSVSVTIHKPAAPIAVAFSDVSVTVHRSQ